MSEKINEQAVETCDQIAKYVEQYLGKVALISASDETIAKIVKAFNGFDPYQVSQIIRDGMLKAVEELDKELASLKAENLRLLQTLNDIEMGLGSDDEWDGWDEGKYHVGN